MNDTDNIINDLQNKKKQMIDNAVSGIDLSKDELRALAYLLNDEIEVVMNIANIILKARIQVCKN